MRDYSFTLIDTGKNRTILFTSALDMDVTESSGYRDFVWAVELHRLGLEIICLWPNTDKIANKRLRSEIRIGIIIILLIFVATVPTTWMVVRVWGNMVLVIGNLQTILPVVIILVKYVIIRWKQSGPSNMDTLFIVHFIYFQVLSSIINMMAEDWMAFKLDVERDVMIRRARTARLIMIFGYALMIISVFTVTVPSYFGVQVTYVSNFTNRNHQLPLATYHFYDTYKSPQFEFNYFIQMITVLVGIFVFMSIDSFFILIILHICGQLENFRHRLINLVLYKNSNKVFRNIVSTHLRLIRFVDNFENTYSLMMLILILHFGVEFCLSGFIFTILLTKNEIDKDDEIVSKMCYSLIVLMFIFMSTFVYCNAGELLTEQCDAVYRALCELEWYKLESRKAKNLILIMMRTHHPFRITAGKIIPLTMATFCSLLKTSTGYTSFLLAKHD